ncbi:MAG: HEAT repeat domain-containing protein [Candidatus Micrarchaeia archaeon]
MEIWDKEGTEDGITGQIRTVLKNRNRGRPSKPPEEIELSRTFNILRSKKTLVEKRNAAEEVLQGCYGIKHEIHAKLLLGPKEFESVIMDKRDIVPPTLEILSEKNPEARVKAAQVLGKRGDERTLLGLYRGLNEEEYWVRFEFANALGEISHQMEDMEYLQEMGEVLKSHVENKGEFYGPLRRIVSKMREIEGKNRGAEKKLVIKPEKAGRRNVDTTLRGIGLKK